MLPNLSVTSRRELTAVGLLSLLATLATLATGQFTLVSPIKQTILKYDSRFSEAPRFRKMDGKRDMTGDWEITETGLVLKPTRHATFETEISNPEKGGLIVLLFGQGDTSLQVTVSVSEDKIHFTPVNIFRSLPNQIRLELTDSTISRSHFWLRISAFVDANGTPAVVSRIRVLVAPPELPFVNLPMAAVIVLTPMLAYLVRHSRSSPGSLRYSLLILSGLLLLIAAAAKLGLHETIPWWTHDSVMTRRDLYLLLVYGCLLGMFLSQIHSDPRFLSLQPLWNIFALSGVILLAATGRIEALLLTAWDSPDPDALWYKYFAETMTGAFDTGPREPLWIWTIRGWFSLMGSSGLSLRILSCIMSLTLILGTYVFVRGLTQRSELAVLAAGLMSTNSYLADLGVRGLRDDAYSLALLSLMYCVFVRRSSGTFRVQLLTLTATCVIIQLLRFNSYTILIPLLALWTWNQIPSRRPTVLLPIICVIIVSIPVMIHNAREFDDPLHLINLHTRWARNQEFVVLKNTGCAGCPTLEEFKRNGYAGTPVSTAQYLFGMHGVGELLAQTFKGYMNVYLLPTDHFHTQSGTKSLLGYSVYLVGLVTLLWSPYRNVYLILGLAANVIPFLISIGLDDRILIHTAPYTTFILAYGIWCIFHMSLVAWTYLRQDAVPALNEISHSV